MAIIRICPLHHGMIQRYATEAASSLLAHLSVAISLVYGNLNIVVAPRQS